jgi:hypothetical protein
MLSSTNVSVAARPVRFTAAKVVVKSIVHPATAVSINVRSGHHDELDSLS